MCDVPTHLYDHLYWRREPSHQQEHPTPSTTAGTTKVAGTRKRQREESSSRGPEEPLERRRRPSPQPSTSTPQARLEDVRLEERTAGGRATQPGLLQRPVDDDVMSLPLWTSVYGPQPGGLPPSAFNTVAAMIMDWMADSPYNPEM